MADGERILADGESGDGAALPTLEAGRVGRAHGLDGSFYVTGARPRLLEAGGRVMLAGQARTIVRRAGTDERPIVRLEGVAGRSAVEALRGSTLTVPLSDAPALANDEWWGGELEGCLVLDGEEPVGVVSGLLELPSCEVLEVRRSGGDELLVPMVKDAVRAIDVRARRIEIDLDFLGER